MRKVHAVAQRSERWHQLRRESVGGSEVAILFGFNNYKSPVDLWMEKRGLKDQEDLSENDDVNRGVVFEAVAAQQAEDAFEAEGWYASGASTHMHCDPSCHMHHSPDGIYYRSDEDGFQERMLLEVKVPRASRIASIKDDGPDLSWIMQAQHGMHCCQCDQAEIVVLDVQSGRIMRWPVRRDDELIAKITSACRHFYKDFVEADEIPYEYKPPSQIEATEVSVDDNGADKDDDDAIEPPPNGSAEIYADLKQQMAELNKELSEAKEEVEKAFRRSGKEFGLMSVGDGRKINRFKVERKGGVNIDLLRAEHPEIDWDRYDKPSFSYPSMRVSGKVTQ